MKVGRQPIQWPGLYLAGLLCVGLAVVKLTAEGHWSWWRVLLPLWVVLGHNALYIFFGFIWLSFIDHGDDGESLALHPNPPQTYLDAGMFCFLLFTDNLVGRMEVPDQRIWFWLRSGRWQLLREFSASLREGGMTLGRIYVAL